MTEVLNVIIVNDHAYVNGGQAKVAIQTAKELAARGLNVIYFAACGPIDKTLRRSSIEVVCLNQPDLLSDPNRRAAALRGIWNRHASSALATLISKFDPSSSIIHCHGFAKALSPSIGPVITRGPLAHLYTLHEYFLACPNGGFFDYQRNQICKRQALGISCLITNCDARHPTHKAWRVMRQAILWEFGCMPRKLRNIIYISETQKLAIAKYFERNTQFHYVPNPIIIDKPKRVKAEKNAIFLFVGRLSPEKGARIFARAAQLAGVKAVFVGDGEERDAVQAENPEATITGWLSENEVASWLENAKCLVFPSLWYECQPLATLEALARGIPVICGHWNAASEWVSDRQTGVLVTDHDVSTWVSAIRTVSERTQHMSILAYRTYWNREANTEPYGDRLLKLYKNIISEHDQ